MPYLGTRDSPSNIRLTDRLDETPLHPPFGPARPVPRSLSNVSTAQVLQSWLQSCEKTHLSCKASSSKLPSRILDISTSIPKLLEFQDEEVPHGIYATISHCWGNPEKSRPTMTTKDTLESRKIGIGFDDLSPLFRDAIQICKMVECNYISIDSLCFIQDDESYWNLQSQKMLQIYSNAHFNIAATSSPDSTHSLFQERWYVGTGNNKDPLHCPVLSYNISPVAGHLVCVRQAHSRDHLYV